MKTVAIFVGVLLLAVIGGNCQSDEMPEAINNVLDTCLNKFDITKEEYTAAVKNNDYNSNPKFRCLSECLMTESGIIQGGEVKIPKIKEIMIGYNPTVTEADIESVHAKCLAQAQQKSDKCDYATEYGECSKTLFMKA